ncbi:MAG TPA: hypothetical protein VE224_18500, partial [Pseudolabrys sp.]|nr:hypothetical protein [Pseudolabrys sp.]
MTAVAKTFFRYSPLLLLAIAWELAARLHLVSNDALPPLSSVIGSWIGLIQDGSLLTNGGASLFRVAAGLG